MKYLILIPYTLLILLVGSYFGFIYYQHQAVTTPVMSYSDAVDFLIAARESHQFYVDHPELLSDESGDLQFNKDLVDRYNEVIEFVEGK